MNKFNFDLQIGNHFEDELLKHIDYDSYERPEGYFPYYDFKFKIENDYITCEVKADLFINKTNNIAIEYECRNKPSGINISTAEYWAIFEYITKEKYKLYIIPSSIIKENIKNKKYSGNVNGGDEKASRLYLFNKDLFKDYVIYSSL